MQKLLPVAMGMAMSVAGCSGDDSRLDDPGTRTNYSIGYQIGSDFRRQGVAISPDVVLEGLEDALSGEKPALKQVEMQAILADLQRRVRADGNNVQPDVAADNLARAQAFLDQNALESGVETLPSGLQYKVINRGDGASPEASDTVTVHYRGTLIDGSEFDSSWRRDKPASFAVNRVIAGWAEALQLMREGDKWQLFIPPALAYGEAGAGKNIPANSALIFEVELLAVNQAVRR